MADGRFKLGHEGSKQANTRIVMGTPFAKRRGKSTTVHPHEASLISLLNRSLKGEPRATKLFLKECEIAGLLEPAPVGQTHGVFVIPKGANAGIMKVLIETYGLPPWDPDVYAALEGEYERDQARIEELYNQFMKDGACFKNVLDSAVARCRISTNTTSLSNSPWVRRDRKAQ